MSNQTPAAKKAAKDKTPAANKADGEVTVYAKKELCEAGTRVSVGESLEVSKARAKALGDAVTTRKPEE